MIKLVKLFLLFLLITHNGYAENIPTRSLVDEAFKSDNFNVGLIVDSSRSMEIDDVLSSFDQMQVIDHQFAIPSVDWDYWFVFNLQNPTKQAMSQIVGFNEACFDIADLYYQQDNQWLHESNGLQIPLNDRAFHCRLPVFVLEMGAGETTLVLLKLHSKYLVPVGVLCDSPHQFKESSNKQFIGYWFYFGAAISILIYNLFLFFQTKNRTYLFYVGYLFFLVVWVSLWSGFFIYLSSSLSLYHFLSCGVAIMSIFIVQFAQDLLKIGALSRIANTILRIVKVVLVVFALLIVIDVRFYQYLGFLGLIITLFLLGVGIYAHFRKVPLARFFVFAMGVYLVGLFTISALTLDLVSYNFFTRYGFMIGSFIEFNVFSFALGHRLKLLQLETIHYKNAVIENERLMNIQLETKVNDRTRELMEATKQLELSNENLQASNQTKDKIFSIISHDLRSPFSSILGLLGVLVEDYERFEEEKRMDLLKKIYLSSNVTYELLDNLLFWSRSQTNRIEFIPTAISVRQLVVRSVGVLDVWIKNKNQILDIDEVADRAIFVDEDMISLVFRNLVNNAVKFTPENGTISIHTEDDIEKRELIVEIKDTGVGIAAEKVKNLFNNVDNISTLGTNNERGSGLGLMLCKEFVEMNKGHIWVKSKVGVGTTFYVAVPLGEK